MYVCMCAYMLEGSEQVNSMAVRNYNTFLCLYAMVWKNVAYSDGYILSCPLRL